ncbi:MAG: MerR family transcriptional regulator [Bacteriovoracia bacterium]
MISFKLATRLTGLNDSTLRAWEKRYKAVTPKRIKKGARRTYTPSDIERLKILNTLVSQGFSIGQIARCSFSQLQELSRSNALVQGAIVDPKKVSEKILDDVNFLHSNDLYRDLQTAKNQLGTRRYVLDVVLPALRETGKRVSEGKMSVAHEHNFSAILRGHLGQILTNEYIMPSSLEPKIAVAGVDGDWHEFGILCSAVLLFSYGLPIQYFGPSVPAKTLATMVKAMGYKTLVVGFSQYALNQRILEHVKALAKFLPSGCELWLGGVSKEAMKRFKAGRRIVLIETLEELDLKLATGKLVRNEPT